MASKPQLLAWRNVGIVTVMFCLLYGLPNFGILAEYLPRKMELRLATALTIAGFGLSASILLFAILVWLRRTKRSLKDLGWTKRTRPAAIVAAVLFAVACLGLGYMNNRRLGVEFPIWRIDLFRVWAAPLMVFAGGFVEEIAMRGIVMTELHQIQTRTWIQILVSGFCFGLYHSLHLLTNPIMFVQGLIASTFMGFIFAGIYVLGRRSLTPCILCHSLANLLGEPYILMGAIVAQMKYG